jgi:putative ABC transport system ATP-binding protein
MQIILKNVIPSYFEKASTNASEIWGKILTFPEGENAHIVAPSGSGKTSLMHFIYGMRNDYTGTITYDNQNIGGFNLDKFSTFRQSSISIVFQDMRLFADQTVRQNIEIKRQLLPFHPPEKIDEMAGRLGIGNKLSRITNSCSYGEKQRIAIIRSLMQPFKFLLLDEPFSHLDDNNRAKAMDLIAEECTARKASMIFADLKKLDFFEGQRILKL